MNLPPPLPLQQHPHFAAALGRLGRDVRLIDVSGAHPVVCVRVLGQMIASRGPVWCDTPDNPAMTAALMRSGLRLVNAEMPQDDIFHAAGFRKLVTAAWVAELGLCRTTDARIAALAGKWRNRWRRAQQAPVQISRERFDPFKHRWLLQADRAQQKAKRFRAMPHRFITAFAAEQRDAATVHIACLADEPVAAMLFLQHAPVVTYHLGWTSAEGRQWGLHHRMLIDAAGHFAQRGYTRLDLGGIDTDNAAGLARFKIGSGAKARPLGSTWLRVARPRL